MKQELDAALVRDFPNLYKDRFANMRTTCMCWGFDVGDGWEPLIRRLSEKLEPLIIAIPEPKMLPAGTCKFGDYPEHPEYEKPRAAQVKEKFGGLRFYMTSETDEMSVAIKEAEAEAWKTCEKCGSPGKPREGGWIVTLCDICANTRGRKIEDDREYDEDNECFK
jgi:hypothetical protein